MAKVKAVTVGRTFNMGNYQSLKLEITVEVVEGETLAEVTEKSNAKLFAMKESLGSKYAEAQAIVRNSKVHSIKEVAEAQEYLESVTQVMEQE